MDNAVFSSKIEKRYKGFKLEVNDFGIPKGFATALVGENGAGKTTLLNILAGLKFDFDGNVYYFGDNKIDEVRNKVGYTAPNDFYVPTWNIKQVVKMNELMFDDFDSKKFDGIADILCIPVDNVKSVKQLSDGNKIKLMLASVLARPTDLLIMDEPASPLDPLMRSKLNDIIQKYLREGNGERTVFFSTHNIADMESVTDYVYVLDNGKILEHGFVEDLREKYVWVKGEPDDFGKCREYLFGASCGKYNFEGLCLADNLDKMAGMKIVTENPNLSQICVGLMKENSPLKDII